MIFKPHSDSYPEPSSLVGRYLLDASQGNLTLVFVYLDSPLTDASFMVWLTSPRTGFTINGIGRRIGLRISAFEDATQQPVLDFFERPFEILPALSLLEDRRQDLGIFPGRAPTNLEGLCNKLPVAGN